MRSRYCKSCGGFHDLEQPWPCFRAPAPNAAPNIRPDGMDVIRNHADGRLYDGKSAYYRAVRQAGCEIVGNEQGDGVRRQYQPQGVAEDIKRAIHELGG